MTATTAAGALAGIRVIDLSHQAAGPWCTSLLGDMGADVIKVEKPGRGDSIRYADRTGRLPPEIGGLNFQGLNRNKRGITIDIGQEAGVALVRRLVRGADVRGRELPARRHGSARPRLGRAARREPAPRLLLDHGLRRRRGPLAQKPGMDLILQATGGIMGHTGEAGGPPIKSAPPVADITTGIYAAYGIASALLARDAHRARASTSRSRCSTPSCRSTPTTPPTCSPRARTSRSSAAAIPISCRTRRSRRSDGYFIVACLTNAFYKRLCAALGRDDLLTDPRFATNRRASQHRAEVVRVLSEIFRTETCEHWIALLERTTSRPAA